MNQISDILATSNFIQVQNIGLNDSKEIKIIQEDVKQKISLEDALFSLKKIREDINNLIEALQNAKTFSLSRDQQKITKTENEILNQVENKIIEGVFNGEKMIGSDGIEYTVPANYASKSKLVEGDIMKLTINHKGSFVYKQIGPIERINLIGELDFDEIIGQWFVKTECKRYKVLTASITFYKGQKGDQISIIAPKDGLSEWAAVENVLPSLRNLN